MRSISVTASTASSKLSKPLANSFLSMSTSTFINQSQTIPLLSNPTCGTSQRLDWESLRKHARQLENEIDSKLVAFSKLCSNYTTSMLTSSPYRSAASSSALPQSGSSAASSSSPTSDLMFMTLSNELEETIKKLTNINTKMSESLASESGVNSNANIHTLQRHRDILRDYSIEYEKTKRNIVQFKEREKLLASNTQRSSISGDNNLNNRGGQTSLYMKEQDHLKSSHMLIDQQIELAELTKENLQSQRQALRFIQQKMNTIAHKFPIINNLVQKIKFKKRKDSIILATVISVCIIILLLYLF